MTKLRGTGIAAVNYPTGMNLGGDPSQALIHATTSGSFVVSLSATDLGQGLRTVISQIAAEALGVEFDQIVIDTADTDTGPHDMGTFASRATHRVGNAVIAAAIEARRSLLEVAAEELEAAVDDLEIDGHGNVMVRGAPARAVKVADIASLAQFKYGRTIAGRGSYMKAKSPVDPETGAMDPDSTEAHACTVAEVEVDTDTGMVTVLSIRSAYEVGRQVNPALVQAQISGRRVDGHVACPVRDDPALLPEPRACRARLQHVPDARARWRCPRSSPWCSRCRPRTVRTGSRGSAR